MQKWLPWRALAEEEYPLRIAMRSEAVAMLLGFYAWAALKNCFYTESLRILKYTACLKELSFIKLGSCFLYATTAVKEEYS